jgi:hypothetical protein
VKSGEAEQMKSFPRATASAERCAVCDLPVESHPRCAECGILVGPHHIDTALVDGLHCFTCRRAVDSWEAAEEKMRGLMTSRELSRRLGQWS